MIKLLLTPSTFRWAILFNFIGLISYSEHHVLTRAYGLPKPLALLFGSLIGSLVSEGSGQSIVDPCI